MTRMREIRFRAWDAKHRCYDYNPIILNGKAAVLDSFDQLEETNQVLQQYTGLKDRNGKEIYEGDIVKQTFHVETRDSNGEWVAFDGHHIGAVSITPRGVVMKNPMKWSEETDEITACTMYKGITGRRAEVIGNIYENHELIRA